MTLTFNHSVEQIDKTNSQSERRTVQGLEEKKKNLQNSDAAQGEPGLSEETLSLFRLWIRGRLKEKKRVYNVEKMLGRPQALCSNAQCGGEEGAGLLHTNSHNQEVNI